VILSGTATDGTPGLHAIKAEGGITFAQDDSAEHTSMPRSAVAGGWVDFVLPPDRIAIEIARIGQHPYVAPRSAGQLAEPPALETNIGGVIELLRHATGVDFSHYKSNTLNRRITRRMVLQKSDTVRDYVDYLRHNPGEVEALYQDILISVTSFFRNPDSFEVLKEKVYPRLTHERSRHDPVRIWVLGCSTGEET
jgi:two-component system CheB/CheR fusion protein